MRIRAQILTVACVATIGIAATLASAQTGERTPPGTSSQLMSSRIGIAAGMGVAYADPSDVVDVVNSVTQSPDRPPQFKAGVEFFGAVVIPLSSSLALKVEYGYFLMSYSGSSLYGPSDFTVKVHLPTLIAQYVLLDAGLYNLKAGAGVGLHFGSLSEQYGTVDDRFSGSGPAALLELEANTAFSEDLFAYLGGNIRWDFIGKLTNSAGTPAGVSASGGSATLHFFSAGVRLGFSYYL
jgi:hypothetical protein